MTRHMGRVRAWGERGARAALNVLIPPHCPIEDKPVANAGALSAEAWARLPFLRPPWCATCGAPFDHVELGSPECAGCASHDRRQPLDMQRAALAYTALSKPLVLGFKHGGHGDMVGAFGVWMAAAGRDALDGAEALVPVPLHPRRLRTRGRNQATALARSVARVTGLPVVPDAITRHRDTRSQNGLSAPQRAANMAGAFRPGPSKRRIEGARVVLIDDVITTGATARACARALRRAGASSVRLLALARVVTTSHDGPAPFPA